MSDYPMLISNKLHSFRNFLEQKYEKKRNLQYQPETSNQKSPPYSGGDPGTDLPAHCFIYSL